MLKVHSSRLTPRECQVVQLLALGMILKDIANELKISYATVEVHLKNARYKLRLDNNLKVVLWAHGILELSGT